MHMKRWKEVSLDLGLGAWRHHSLSCLLYFLWSLLHGSRECAFKYWIWKILIGLLFKFTVICLPKTCRVNAREFWSAQRGIHTLDVSQNVGEQSVIWKSKRVQQYHGPSTAGFSFETGDRTFRPVVCHSMSGTLMKISAFFLKILLLSFFLFATHELTAIRPFRFQYQLSNFIINFQVTFQREFESTPTLHGKLIPLETAFLKPGFHMIATIAAISLSITRFFRKAWYSG